MTAKIDHYEIQHKGETFPQKERWFTTLTFAGEEHAKEMLEMIKEDPDYSGREYRIVAVYYEVKK